MSRIPDRTPLKNNTLILAEGMAAELMVSRAEVVGIHIQEGYSEVGYRILTNELSITGFDFIVLLGRADLWDVMQEFKKKVADCIQAIRAKNDRAVIMLTASLPSPFDDYSVPSRVGMRNNYLSLLAKEGPGLDFAKPRKALICGGRVSRPSLTRWVT